MRIRILAVALTLACAPSMVARAQDDPCTSKGHIVITKILGDDGRTQIVAEASNFCYPIDALAAGLAAGFEAQRAEYLKKKIAGASEPPRLETVAAHN